MQSYRLNLENASGRITLEVIEIEGFIMFCSVSSVFDLTSAILPLDGR